MNILRNKVNSSISSRIVGVANEDAMNRKFNSHQNDQYPVNAAILFEDVTSDGNFADHGVKKKKTRPWISLLSFLLKLQIAVSFFLPLDVTTKTFEHFSYKLKYRIFALLFDLMAKPYSTPENLSLRMRFRAKSYIMELRSNFICCNWLQI